METIDALKQKNAELTAENERLREQARQLGEITRAFQESQSRFRAVFEASRLGNKINAADLKILQVNPALVKLLGYSAKEDIVGTAILDYSPPERHEEWRHLQQELWKHSAPSFSLETVLIRKDGSLIWCQVTSILFTDNGETLGYTIIEDITEQYKLRQQKEEFISVASHELRTPVTSMKATLQLLNHMLEKEHVGTDGLRKLVHTAEKGAEKLTYLIADLLNTQKIEQGQLALNRTIFAAGEVMNNCCSHIGLEGIYHLKFDGDPNTPVYADQQKIEQVLVNLVNNAIKYAPKSLDIALRVERLPCAVKITVTDHGPGIAPEHLNQLFNRYFRVDGEKSQAEVWALAFIFPRRSSGGMAVKWVSRAN